MVSQAHSTPGNIIIFRAAGVVAPVVNPIHFEAARQICTAEGNIFLDPITFLCSPSLSSFPFNLVTQRGYDSKILKEPGSHS